MFNKLNLVIFIICLFLFSCSSQQVIDSYAKRPLPKIVEKGLKPLKVKPPCFPMQAIRDNLEGWVQLEFQLDDAGKAKDVKIVDNSPRGMFEACALRSIKNWVFSIPEDHKEKENYQYVFQFTLG